MFRSFLRVGVASSALLLAAASGTTKPQQQNQPYGQQPYAGGGQQQPYGGGGGQQQPYGGGGQQPYGGGGQQQPYGGGGQQGGGQQGGSGAGFGGGGNANAGGGGEDYNSGWSQDGDIVQISFDMDDDSGLGRGFCGHAERAGCQIKTVEDYACFAQCAEGGIGLSQEGRRVTMGCSALTVDQCQGLMNRILETP